MNVQVYDVGGGVTVIMADAMVSWQSPRPTAEVIPASVTTVTIAASASRRAARRSRTGVRLGHDEALVPSEGPLRGLVKRARPIRRSASSTAVPSASCWS